MNVQSAPSVGFKEPVECLYLALMLRWERKAPPDGHQGMLDGKPARNTQIARMANVLKKIGAGDERRIYPTLASHTIRRDGRSYVSKDHSWMKEPEPLLKGWYFEGCTSLAQKQEILRNLRHLGFSLALIRCAQDFVAGNSVQKYIPSDDEQEEIVRAYEARNGSQSNDVH